jgi:hypothetical protein
LVAAERGGGARAGDGGTGRGLGALLDNRGKTHGPWLEQAVCAQAFKDLARAQPGWTRLLPMERESIEMVFVKLSRILNGQPHFVDHWDDMAGYPKITADKLRVDRP